jgi:hypothetical protein
MNITSYPPNPVPLRPEASPGRFEVWEANMRRRAVLESVHGTAEEAMRAVDALFTEWGSHFVAIDTWQSDHQAQVFYRSPR